MRKKNFLPIFSLLNIVHIGLALTIGLVYCDTKSPNDPQYEPDYAAPVQADDGWQTAPIVQVDLENHRLLSLLTHINGNQNRIFC